MTLGPHMSIFGPVTLPLESTPVARKTISLFWHHSLAVGTTHAAFSLLFKLRSVHKNLVVLRKSTAIQVHSIHGKNTSNYNVLGMLVGNEPQSAAKGGTIKEANLERLCGII